MIRQLVAAACLCSNVAFAQTQPPLPAGSPNPSGSTHATHVNVSGCVERTDQMPPAGAAPTVDSLSFVLIKPVTARPTGTSGSTTVGSDAAAATNDRLYRLDAPVEQLNLHVGHKVEVTGTLADALTSPAGAGSSTNVPRLKVESVKLLDTMCSR